MAWEIAYQLMQATAQVVVGDGVLDIVYSDQVLSDFLGLNAWKGGTKYSTFRKARSANSYSLRW